MYPNGPQQIIDCNPTVKESITRALFNDNDTYKFFTSFDPDYSVTIDGLLLYQNRIVVPEEAEIEVNEECIQGTCPLQVYLIDHVHNLLQHTRFYKTLEYL